MVSDYEIECWTGDHYTLAIALWPFGVIWAIGIPVWFWLTLKKLRARVLE
jgi:hypothetical protein